MKMDNAVASTSSAEETSSSAFASTTLAEATSFSKKTRRKDSRRSGLKQSILDDYNFSSLRISKNEFGSKTAIDDEIQRIEKAIFERSEHEETFGLFRKSPFYEADEDDPEYVERIDIIAIRRNIKYYDQRVREIRSLGNGTNSKAELLLELPLNNAVEIFSELKEVVRKSNPTEYEFHSQTGVGIIAHDKEKKRLENKLIAIVKMIYIDKMRSYIIKKEEPI